MQATKLDEESDQTLVTIGVIGIMVLPDMGMGSPSAREEEPATDCYRLRRAITETKVSDGKRIERSLGLKRTRENAKVVFLTAEVLV